MTDISSAVLEMETPLSDARAASFTLSEMIQDFTDKEDRRKTEAVHYLVFAIADHLDEAHRLWKVAFHGGGASEPKSPAGERGDRLQKLVEAIEDGDLPGIHAALLIVGTADQASFGDEVTQRAIYWLADRLQAAIKQLEDIAHGKAAP